MMRFLFITMGMVFLSGCGLAQSIGEVHGQLDLDGQPMGRVQVQLWWLGDVSEPAGSAMTDAQGVFCVNPGMTGRSWPAGEYAIVLRDLANLAGKPPVPGIPTQRPQSPSRIGAQFSNRSKTPYKVELHAGTNYLDSFTVSAK